MGQFYYVRDLIIILCLNKHTQKIYQIALGTTLISNDNTNVRPFFSVYSGLYFFRYSPNNYLISLSVTAPPSNISEISLTKGFISMTFGLQVPLTAMFELNLQASYSFTFDRIIRQDFFPVLCGIEYSFQSYNLILFDIIS